MREDMFKVIVERPRSGRSRATKSKLRYVKSGAPARMSGKRIVMQAGGATKYLNENLAPLKRYLHKQRGRKWDVVFSEICQHLDTGSTVKMHVREHLGDFIMRNVRLGSDGQYWASGYWSAPIPPSDWAELYVDPKDGLIKDTGALCRKLKIPARRDYWKARRAAYSAARQNHAVKHLCGKTYAVQMDGIWYGVEISGDPALPRGADMAADVVWDALVDPVSSETTKVYVVSKKQLPKKQLRKHGLSNKIGGHYG